MAESVGPAQSPALCQFCEESVEIRWLCFYCELYLCETCKTKIHSKMKKNQNHRVIALRDMNSKEAMDTRRKVDLEKLTCEVHKDQKCVSFCLDCHATLCLTCHDEHKNHHKNELGKLFEEKFREIQKVKQDIDNKLSVMELEETTLTQISQDKSEEFNKVRDDIGKREAEIITEVKKYSQKLYDKVDKVYQPIVTEVQNNLSELNRMKIHLKEKKVIVDNILHSYQARDVLNSSKTIGNIPVPQQSGAVPTTRCLFTPGDSLDSKVEQMFGEINTVPELKLIHLYQTELNGVGNVINWNKNEKVISSYSRGKLQRLRFDNDTMTVIKEEGITVYDMAQMENGDLVISTAGNELKIYTKEGAIEPYKSFHPLFTLGVHVNRQNGVLVGLSDKTTPSNVKPKSISKIMVFYQTGDIQHTYHYTRDKKRLFTWPKRITTCQDIICVVDILNNSSEGRVVALDYGGHVQWVYNGEGNESHNTFYPSGMVVTPTDLSLICDYKNHAIHVLNPRGQVIVCHDVKGLGVECPFSLCMENEGLLWVGCKAGKDNKANVHTITIR